MAGVVSHRVKMANFFKNLLYFQACIRQTECISKCNGNERSFYQYCKFHDYWVLVLGHGYISHIVQMLNFFKILFSIPEHRSEKLSTILKWWPREFISWNCKFHDSLAEFFNHLVEIYNFFKIFSSTANIDQRNFMMTKKRSIIIVNFWPAGRGPCAMMLPY